MLWAYVIPRGSMFTSVSVLLENPGFETPDHYKPTTRPRAFGIWNGDPAAVVGEDSGVRPREGRHMLRLELPPGTHMINAAITTNTTLKKSE